MAQRYEHSVQFDAVRCNGCTACTRHCPTEAIRIKDGHAIINEDRCIDCGECIRVCPRKAKKAVCASLDSMNRFKYKIALPSPTLYGQFENLDDVDDLLDGLLKLGFDDIYEVSKAAEFVSAYTRLYLKTDGIVRPVITSACPVVMRLIELRFPSLIGHVMHMLPPDEVAARLAKERALKNHPELKPEDIGTCLISSCPGKVSYVKNRLVDQKSEIDEVVSIKDIYFSLIGVMSRGTAIDSLCESGMIGIGWASTGGQSTAIFNENYLAADGIENVTRVLDQIENGNIPQLEFIELNACTGGCVGGVMAMENPFIAKARLQKLRHYLPVSQNFIDKDTDYIPENYLFNEVAKYTPIMQLSDNMAESMRMMSDIQKIKAKLPNIDCAACGAPNCRAFAEDIVKGLNTIDNCPILKSRQKEK